MDGSPLEELPQGIQDKIWKDKRSLERQERDDEKAKSHEKKTHLYLFFDVTPGQENRDHALVLYQKGNNWLQIIWNLSDNTFTTGQWLTHAKVEPHKCQFYGDLFLYDYISTGQSRGNYRYSVISKIPYFTALMLTGHAHYNPELTLWKSPGLPKVVWSKIPTKVVNNTEHFQLLGDFDHVYERPGCPKNIILTDKTNRYNYHNDTQVFDKNIAVDGKTIHIDGIEIWNSDGLVFFRKPPPDDYPQLVPWEETSFVPTETNKYRYYIDHFLAAAEGEMMEWSVLREEFRKWHDNTLFVIPKRADEARRTFIEMLGPLVTVKKKRGFIGWNFATNG